MSYTRHICRSAAPDLRFADVEPAARHVARAEVGTGQANEPEVRFEVGVQRRSPRDPRAGVAVVADQPDVPGLLERLLPDLRVRPPEPARAADRTLPPC